MPRQLVVRCHRHRASVRRPRLPVLAQLCRDTRAVALYDSNSDKSFRCTGWHDPARDIMCWLGSYSRRPCYVCPNFWQVVALGAQNRGDVEVWEEGFLSPYSPTDRSERPVQQINIVLNHNDDDDDDVNKHCIDRFTLVDLSDNADVQRNLERAKADLNTELGAFYLPSLYNTSVAVALKFIRK